MKTGLSAQQLVPGPYVIDGRMQALLLRQTLEMAIDQWWASRSPAMINAAWRSKFVAFAVGRAIGDGGLHQLWCELSSASHVRAYDLQPTGVELDDWRQRVAAAVDMLPVEQR